MIVALRSLPFVVVPGEYKLFRGGGATSSSSGSGSKSRRFATMADGYPFNASLPLLLLEIAAPFPDLDDFPEPYEFAAGK